ncbi:amylo-alpha-1,6-glucosidase [Thioalkalicoccus limnaeus]|uniref:Amylo-alpha-1,6-glucosidase n=1 Tax=Thioalkalicoccus limnaeus TaxID=120681 RepID=A0ABV4BLL4_9GAMM
MVGDPPSGLPEWIRHGRAHCGEAASAERGEWWLANGRGAYASGTVGGALTRRYHGLLVAPIDPPLGRRLVLAKADATLIDGSRVVPLFTNGWAGGHREPTGHVQIEQFRLVGRLPVWRYAVGNWLLEQCVWMPHGEHTTVIAWRLHRAADRAPPILRVALLVADRDHHQVSRLRWMDPEVRVADDRLAVGLQGGTSLQLIAVGGTVAAEGIWIERLDLPAERDRGLEDTDHHLRVGRCDLRLEPGRWCGLVASLEGQPNLDLETGLEAVLRRDCALLVGAQSVHAPLRAAPDWVAQLILAADSFLIERPIGGNAQGHSVIAGYPWFGDWGRDTMIALPGLALATGRETLARQILETYAGLVDGGLLPNHFPGHGERPAYNTVDAALWYIEAWRAYLAATGDRAALRRVFPVLEAIIAHYRDGTRHGIAMDPRDGLIQAGDADLALTWMDAKVGDWVVTPRRGKPVEVNALWYNALRSLAELAAELGESATAYLDLADRAALGFARYRRGPGLGLYDLLDGPAGDDPSIRPNQVLAVSLRHSPLAPTEQAAVVAECATHLACSYGLRSLSPADPAYVGTYQGDVRQRDGAYHQGTAWAWLLGHFALAEYRVTGDAASAQDRLEPFADHLGDAGLGTISEIFDGDPPHRPKGAPAQAWSVACTLAAWLELETARLAARDSR